MKQPLPRHLFASRRFELARVVVLPVFRLGRARSATIREPSQVWLASLRLAQSSQADTCSRNNVRDHGLKRRVTVMGGGNRNDQLDYEDFLCQRRLPLWDKNSAQARMVRRIGKVIQCRSAGSDEPERRDGPGR